MTPVEPVNRELRDAVVAHLSDGTSVEVVGLPGSGRSTLLDAVVRTLDDTGWTVVRVHGVRALRSRPLEALAVAGLVPRGDARASTAVSVAASQLETALRGPRSVLVLDDVDVLDETSYGVVAAAHARRAFPVLAASRPGQGAHLADLQPVVRITVQPLGFEAFQDLLADVLPGAVSAGLAGRLFTLSGGLPRLALTIVELARRRGAFSDADGTWRIVGDAFAPELAPTVEPFLDGLSDDARSTLEALSLVGTVPVAAARELSTTDALAELETSGLLRFATRGDALVVGVYPHAVAEYLRRSVPQIRRLVLDDRLRAATDDPPPAGPPLPVQLPAPSTLRHPPHAAPEVETSGTVLNRLFLEEWYRSTLARRADWEREPSARTALPYLRTLVVGDADRSTVRDLMDRTPPSDDPAWQARWAIWRADVLAELDGDLAAATTVLAEAQADLVDLGPWLDAGGRWLRTLHDTVPPEPLVVPPRRVPAVARRTVVTVEAQRLLAVGDPVGALALHEGDDAAVDPDPGSTVNPDTWSGVVRGVALVAAGRSEEALRTSRAALERGRVALDPDVVHGHGYVVSLALLLLARTTELRSHLSVTLSIGLRSSLHRQFEAGNRSIAAVVAAIDGRVDTAHALAQQASALPGHLGPYPATSPTWALAQLDVWRHAENPDARRRAADSLWEESQALLARGAVLAGGVVGALAIDFSADAERLARLEAACAGTDSELLRALLRLGRASGAGADELLAVGRSLVADGHVLMGARAFAHAAGRLQQAGDPEAVRAALTDARELVRSHGGEPGMLVRPVHRAVRLTPREREIAGLAIAGLSNEDVADQLHLSVRTVQNTLGRACAKLGVPGRAELTRDLLGA